MVVKPHVRILIQPLPNIHQRAYRITNQDLLKVLIRPTAINSIWLEAEWAALPTIVIHRSATAATAQHWHPTLQPLQHCSAHIHHATPVVLTMLSRRLQSVVRTMVPLASKPVVQPRVTALHRQNGVQIQTTTVAPSATAPVPHQYRIPTVTWLRHPKILPA